MADLFTVWKEREKNKEFGYLHGNKTNTETDGKNAMQTEPTDSLLSSSGASGLVAFTSNKQKGGKKQERERERGQRCEACHTRHNQRLTDEDSRETLLFLWMMMMMMMLMMMVM